MQFSRSNFDDDTSFERFALASLGAHQVRPKERDAIFHLEGSPRGGGATIDIAFAASLGTQRIEDFKASLRVLGFGAAYKTLDLMIEHVLRANGAPQGHLTFKAKAVAVTTRPRKLPPPLDAYPELWDRLAKLYVALADARHAVTHRRGGVSAAGDLQVHDNQGHQTDTVPASEVASFMGAAHSVAELVIDASSDPRRIGILAWYLNEVASRHGFAVLPASDPIAGVGLMIADLATQSDTSLRIDVRQLRENVDRQAARDVWDLELRGDGRVFTGRWEDVPDKIAEYFDFDPALPPAWLTEQFGR
jgi:hypothetical protein